MAHQRQHRRHRIDGRHAIPSPRADGHARNWRHRGHGRHAASGLGANERARWRHAPLLVHDTNPGLVEGLAVPNYATCIKISTDASSQTQHAAGCRIVGRRLGGGHPESIKPDSVASDNDVSTGDVVPAELCRVGSIDRDYEINA